eukprot:scaffold4157_cov136-Cylindrotheca_fusiformis.AAC.22
MGSLWGNWTSPYCSPSFIRIWHWRTTVTSWKLDGLRAKVCSDLCHQLVKLRSHVINNCTRRWVILVIFGSLVVLLRLQNSNVLSLKSYACSFRYVRSGAYVSLARCFKM